MRKALFAVVLVAAAFGGGAAMNGPGMDRLKAAIRARIAPDSPSPWVPQTSSRREVPATPPPPLTFPTRPTLPANPVGADSVPSPPVPISSTIGVATPPPRSAASPAEIAPADLPPPPADLALPPSVVDVPPTDPAVAQATATPRDWGEVRRRMKTLGVARYELQGEPEGKSRFRCLIPLAGRRAVSQLFEGEGDDDLQAAEAALRRVALWRATENTPP